MHQLRLLLLALAVGLGILALEMTGSAVARMDASLTLRDQVIWTVLITGPYALIGALAWKDIRACGLLAMVTGVLFTPVLGLLWLFSQWSEAGARASKWLGLAHSRQFHPFFPGPLCFLGVQRPGNPVTPLAAPEGHSPIDCNQLIYRVLKELSDGW